MTLATASTVVRAVRQHGGGLVHTQQPRAHARGRQRIPRGGAINRRCEATSIIHSLLPSSAAAAYPLTGVRRARTLSPSLRFNNRPHAQLVVGYGHHKHQPTLIPYSHSPESGVVGMKSPQFFSHRLEIFCPLFQLHFRDDSDHLGVVWMSPKHCINFQQVALTGQKHTPPDCGCLFIDQRCESSLKNCSPSPKIIGVIPGEPLAVTSRDQFVEELIHFHARHVTHQSILISREICFISFLAHSSIKLPCRDRYCDEDAYQRPHSLYPRRPVSFHISPRQEEQTEAKEERRNDYQRHCPSLLEPGKGFDSKFRIQHDQLQASNSALSLQAPRHYVQRGAA
ncbi:hypothetical protein F471_03711 [Pseudomonas sp. URMO17WK12:I1]|nr:hypothetical protein F471_03711 [Pseudomonas sp. URMO17WK12:I1]